MFNRHHPLTSLPADQAYALVGPQVSVTAHGVAKSFSPTINEGGLDDQDRFKQVATWVSNNMQDDELAFFAFTFNPFQPGSHVVVPQTVTTCDGFGPTNTAFQAKTVHALLYPTDKGCASDTIICDPVEFKDNIPRVPESSGSSASESQQFTVEAKTITDHPDYDDWATQVSQASTEITDGLYQKVVLARTDDMPLQGKTASDITAGLRDVFPSCLVYRFNQFMGATPEILLEVKDRHLTSLVLAGSAPNTPEGKASLMASAKDILEHQLAAQSVLEKLSPHCDIAQISESQVLLELPNVVHIASTITGKLAKDAHVLEALGDLHPTAAVCGTPRNTAMAKILEYEKTPRGYFAGPVGVIHANGDALVALAIRCGEIQPDNQTIRLYAGCGIMGESDPKKEFIESELKLKAMRAAMSVALV